MFAILIAAMLAALAGEGDTPAGSAIPQVPGTTAYGHSERVGGLECDTTDP